MASTGVRARRALCRFASPFARPGPRCSSVVAGPPVIRPYPSAAPVAVPSNRHSTPRISGTASSAATKCISDVPGLAKHTSTPHPASVLISACAPFTTSPPVSASLFAQLGGERLGGSHPPRVGHQLRQAAAVHLRQPQHHQRPAVVAGRSEEEPRLAEQQGLFLGLVTDIED